MAQILSDHVFTAAEVARAAGVASRDVEAGLLSGQIRPIPGTSFITGSEAVRAGRKLRLVAANRLPAAASLFAASASGAPATFQRRGGLPAVVSSAFHAALIAVAFWFSAGTDTAAVDDTLHEPTRLVFIMSPGPGGGGGGGGLRNPVPPPKAKRRGLEPARVSVPEVTLPPPAPQPVEHPPEPLPSRPIVAPVVAAAADPQEEAGVIERPAETPPSQGPGVDSGRGSGQGAGNGEGAGGGIGDGAGGGIGGGPYRPGSGVTAPRLRREVKAEYTDEARRRGVTGDVVLEIVVTRDGSVGDVKVLQSLGLGLDQRAIAAVRQWRFEPARLRGTPVDVVVEVAVEFTLR